MNNIMENSGSESTQPQTEHNQNAAQQAEMEKGSGYGAPNEGSGQSVDEQDLSPDGQPIPGAGTSEQSGEMNSSNSDE